MKRPRTRGGLLALEGIDGVGKSTLQAELLRRLRARGWRVSAWREPVDRTRGSIAQRLGPTDPFGAAVQFTLDRLRGRSRLDALLRRQELVISDRSFHSTLAYQGSALPPSTRRALARLQPELTVVPDRVLLLDLPHTQAMSRVGHRGGPLAPLERQRTLRRVAAAYRRAARDGGWWVEDASRAPELLAQAAEERVLKWLHGRTGSPGRRG